MGVKEAYDRMKSSVEAESMLFREADKQNNKRLRQFYELSMRRIIDCMQILVDECPEIEEKP